MGWLGLSLLAALAVATTDALIKKGLADYRPGELVMVHLAGPAVVLSPILIVEPLPPLPAEFWLLIAVLVPLELAALALYMMAIRDHPLAATLPYLAFTPVVITLTGWLILGETVSAAGLAGIVLVVAGALVLNVQGAPTPAAALAATASAMLRARGARLMLTVAVIYSLTSVLAKAAMGYVDPSRFAAFYTLVLAAAAALTLSIGGGGRITALWRRPLWTLAIGLAAGIETLAHMAAVARIDVAYMIAVKRSSLLFGIAYGALLFGERDVVRHLLGGAVMVAGVAVIAFT